MVDEWLQPLPDPAEPCGKDFEYDNEFLELIRVSQGKPETQFGPGEPPNWREVREMAETLMARTRDLRVALLWVRASIHRAGFSALPPGLRLLHGLLDNFWDHLHPLPDPDDGDPYSRANALAILPQQDGLLGDVRQCLLFNLRGAGELRVRSIAIALTQISAKADEVVFSKEQLTQMIASAAEQNPELLDQPKNALVNLQLLGRAMVEKFGAAEAPDIKPLSDLIKGVQSMMPAPVEQQNEAEAEGAGEVSSDGRSAATPKAALGNVTTRDDALRAIDMVCAYLERTEPTSPAQLLLRRARKLINHNFLQLIKELAPDALHEAARVMGVDPESVILDNEA
jgi:type VI secretion system protein ImpA